MSTSFAMADYRVVKEGADRREHVRRPVHLRAEAIRIGNTISAHRHMSLDLQVNDFSDGGLAATAEVPLELGERIAMFFPSHLGQHVYDLVGRVIRCEPSGIDYQIALAFDAMAA